MSNEQFPEHQNANPTPGRLDYVKYDSTSTQLSESFRTELEKILVAIEEKIECRRSKDLAITSLENVFMWIGKGIRDDQVRQGRGEQHVPERTDLP